jgi:chondroitin 4-sulfotransferase 11
MSSIIFRLLGRKKKVSLPSNVNLGKGFIFIHVPKTAGTSIYNALGIDKSHHKFLTYYKEMIDGDVFGSLKTFAFVRDPLSRFLSLYNYARLEVSYFHNNLNPDNSIYGIHQDYELLKNASLYDCAQYLIEGRLVHNAPECVWLPQTRWLENDAGLIEVDEIGRFETLQKDFSRICLALGLGEIQSGSLDAVNASEKLPPDVDADVINIVRDYYREDYANFRYSV